MDNKILMAIIGVGSAILGSIATHVATLKSEKRKEKRQLTKERLQKLYAPLLKMLTEGSPPDGYDPPESIYPKVFDFIEKNRMYATHRLLNIFWEMQYNFAINGHFSSDEKYKLFSIVSKEHDKLKEMIGFKEILAKDID